MRILGTVTSFAIFSMMLLAQAPQDKGQHPPPKNLQVLTPDELHSGVMQKYAAALGGKCQICHVQGDFASDENPHKKIARDMIKMTKEINAKFPDGKEHVTCYTCHRGSHEPAMAPPADTKPAL
ncbi:MAG TPA: c-type cytochrome [Bryobacteraceae bacterium]|nr:c-type cytochrome [Bryobacteraceae bacterium]